MHKYKQPAVEWGFRFTNPSEILFHEFSVGWGNLQVMYSYLVTEDY